MFPCYSSLCVSQRDWMHFLHQKYRLWYYFKYGFSFGLGFFISWNYLLYCREKLRNHFCVDEQFKRVTVCSICILLDCVFPEKGINKVFRSIWQVTHLGIGMQAKFLFCWSLVWSCNVEGEQGTHDLFYLPLPLQT